MDASALPPGSAHVAAGLSESADPGWPGGLGVWGGGEGVPELEGIQAKGWLQAKARGGGWRLGWAQTWHAGGAVGAVLGGRGACGALKWEL